MIVMNDKVPQTQNVEASLIQMTVLGDTGWPLCDAETTYTGPAKVSSTRTSPAESSDYTFRHLTEVQESTNAQPGFARFGKEPCGEAANGRGQPYGEAAAEESTEGAGKERGDKISEGPGTRSYKRKLECGEANHLDLPKQSKTAKSSERVYPGNVPVRAGEIRLVPNLGSNDHEGREEKVEATSDTNSPPSGTPEQAPGAISTPEFRARRHNDLGRNLGDSGVCLARARYAYPLSRGQEISAIHHTSHGIGKETHPPYVGQDGHNRDMSDHSVRSSFASQCTHTSRYQSEGTLGALNESSGTHQRPANLLDNHWATLNSDFKPDPQSFRQDLERKAWQSNSCPRPPRQSSLTPTPTAAPPPPPMPKHPQNQARQRRWHPIMDRRRRPATISSTTCLLPPPPIVAAQESRLPLTRALTRP
eukprot:gi/632981084/ref/XP_007907395.1/ PREDICTED: uncharacterized protein LOC103188982 [Callorhinchus milii]